ncbi:protein of unknown function [Pseudodesulfovibrio piezophilus C1TLV30]|uniref:Uncharacterized protein n=1 Tax=Pseudodesulfovibrio piezophilus (strain DSM 21447 / JCM 15486 / C1TLV30) TaxID=1322246 RepID=M1WLN4_PSEP2|nr:protein of unknown function [Pseudodesulfovibrio piezophilus C1TLV30]
MGALQRNPIIEADGAIHFHNVSEQDIRREEGKTFPHTFHELRLWEAVALGRIDIYQFTR